MEVQLGLLEESLPTVRTDVLFLLHVDPGEVRLQVLWSGIRLVTDCTLG